MKIPTFLYETVLEQRVEKSLHYAKICLGVCFYWFAYLSIKREACLTISEESPTLIATYLVIIETIFYPDHNTLLLLSTFACLIDQRVSNTIENGEFFMAMAILNKTNKTYLK